LAIANRLAVAMTASHRMKLLQIKEYFDPVTLLFNRQACQDRLTQEMSRARRQNKTLATFYLNINDFKKINDEFGYGIGDALLQLVGAKLKSSLRDIDVLARFSADEFVVIVSDLDIASHATLIADKIHALFLQSIKIEQHSFNLTISIGISVFPQDGLSVEELIHHASTACVNAKKKGAGHSAFYEENMSVRYIWEASIERDLRRAMAQNELFMVYQPQYNARSGKIVGVEALVRWQHPERGLVSPAEFVPIAEQTGLIVQLGQYTRRHVFEQYAKWQLLGMQLPKVALNLSSAEIKRQEFIPELQQLLSETGIKTHLIELEITENLHIESTDHVLENLKKMHEMGVSIAIDDFGTGYSNLGYLVRLPFDILKIDRSFMQEVGKYAGSSQIITMMIDVGHHLGKLVCAEGVENDEQYQFLVESGCDMVQGYLLSKPLNAADLKTLLSQEYANNKAIAA
jgi:diguanylate cyclase (GGDEF)-like protein